MMDAQGVVGTYFPNAGQQTGTYDGAARAVELPSGGVVGADYDGFNTGNIRSYAASGQLAWTSTAWEAWTPCVVANEIYLGAFQTGPIRRWDYAGNWV
jgi:hypothetical protein